MTKETTTNSEGEIVTEGPLYRYEIGDLTFMGRFDRRDCFKIPVTLDFPFLSKNKKSFLNVFLPINVFISKNPFDKTTDCYDIKYYRFHILKTSLSNSNKTQEIDFEDLPPSVYHGIYEESSKIIDHLISSFKDFLKKKEDILDLALLKSDLARLKME